jgi:PAS domain S-box-containing protein
VGLLAAHGEHDLAYAFLQKRAFLSAWLKRAIDVNQTFLSLFGYERKEVVGMAPAEFHPPEFRDVARRMNLSWAETRCEAVCLKKNGLMFRAEIRGRAVPYRGRTVRVTALHPLNGITRDA